MNYLLLILVVSIFFLFIKNGNRKKIINSKIPGPKGLPIVGNLIELARTKKNLHLKYLEWFENYGPIFKVSIGSLETVVLTGYPVLREAFVDNSEIFTSRYQRENARSVNGYKGLINSNGEYHKNLKSVVLSEMTSTRIKKMESHINQESKRLCELLDQHAKDGTPFKMNKYLNLFSINIILRFLFGVNFPYTELDDGSTSIIQVIQKFLQHVSKPSPTSYFPFLSTFINDRSKEFYDIHKLLSKHINTLIEKYKDSKQQQMDGATETNITTTILDKLLIEVENNRITQSALISICIDVLIAGTDTVGQTLSFAIVALVNNPEIQEKLSKNIIDAMESVNDDHYSFSKYRSSIPYLSLTVKEVFRMYPAGILGLPHMTTEDCQIQGYTIAKGTQIIQNIYSTHRSESFWSNPNHFIPERHTQKDNNNDTSKCVHFAVGSRNCLGMSLAETEVHTAIAELLSRFKFTNPSTTPLNDDGIFSIALTCHDFFVKIQRRN
ncbi:hypothetical protein RB653_009632 [Dictyostelium firmibasis]|uniref:Cytochrome P450 n=1 Tax=Dictyostelium firmibasis TaxID=79012 RepID=A0AAN7U5C6_9MYCE